MTKHNPLVSPLTCLPSLQAGAISPSIGIGMWGAAALSLTSDVPLATGNGGPRGLCHRKPDGRHMCSASRSWEMTG